MTSTCRFLVCALGLLLLCLGLAGESLANVSSMLTRIAWAPEPPPGLTEAELDAWAAKIRAGEEKVRDERRAAERRFSIQERIANTLVGLYFAFGAIRLGLRVRRGKPVALGFFFYLFVGVFVAAALDQGIGPRYYSSLDESSLEQKVEKYRQDLRRAAAQSPGKPRSNSTP